MSFEERQHLYAQLRSEIRKRLVSITTWTVYCLPRLLGFSIHSGGHYTNVPESWE